MQPRDGIVIAETVFQKCTVKKVNILKNFAKFIEKHLCPSLFFNKVAALRPATVFKKETLAQVFSCEFCEILMSSSFYRTPLVAASVTG